ncbi:polysaccharide deacetylase family protein [Mangrovimonas sp. TPBH4]|uniref:polysaccharide deacetylase family protein n=1 Tax=Mangrovimonas sp. TPBH4 TaxID=1645914 RepID=UPI0006B55B02|nr:polysaccharide deacetylase family protein [Mangrovimonas sp. TPBH4]
MKVAPAKTPEVMKKMFPNYVWDMPSGEKNLYLTFDDGPTPEITEWTLDILKQFEAKATFFCIGDNIKKYPEIFHKVLQEEHRIGNHTFNHLKGWKTETEDYLKNTLKAQQIIDSESSIIDVAHHTVPKLFRPPYGKIKPSQTEVLLDRNYRIVMWDVISYDWDKDISKEQCLEYVTSKAKDGSIVVFHDSVKANRNMSYALPKALEHFKQIGFSFKTL